MRNAVETTVVLLLLLLITLSGCGKSDVEAYRETSNADTNPKRNKVQQNHHRPL